MTRILHATLAITRQITLIAGLMLALKIDLEIAHEVYPWALHVPLVVVLLTLLAWGCFTLAQACLED